MDKNTHYFICTGDYLDDEWDNIQDYLYSVIKPAKTYQPAAQVKTSKLVAKKLGLRSTRASTIIVDESAKIALEQKFNLTGNFGVVCVADAF